jgi:hypothetical protein
VPADHLPQHVAFVGDPADQHQQRRQVVESHQRLLGRADGLTEPGNRLSSHHCVRYWVSPDQRLAPIPRVEAGRLQRSGPRNGSGW